MKTLFQYSISFVCHYHIFQAKTNKKFLDHVFLAGQRRNGKLLYVRKLKCLYVKKQKSKKATDYICYQTILRKNMKKNSKNKVPACTSRVKVDNHGRCTRKRISHTMHENHEKLYKDMISKNNFLDDVVTLSNQLAGLSTEVSSQDIFTRELAK